MAKTFQAFQTGILIVDCYSHSHYIKISSVRTTTSKGVIQKVKRIFGIPECLVSDNGPQFASEEFNKHFSDEYAFEHVTTFFKQMKRQNEQSELLTIVILHSQ